MSSIKSLNSDQRSYVKFVNKSPRRVDIFWVNFEGKLVRYANNLPPNGTMEIFTFVTHPWMARDAESWDVIHLNKSQVYMPVAWEKNAPREVHAHLPVYSLQERAMQVLRAVSTPAQMKDFEVAIHVKKGLLADRSVQYREYQPQRP